MAFPKQRVSSVPACKKIKANRKLVIKTTSKKMNSEATINKLSKEKSNKQKVYIEESYIRLESWLLYEVFFFAGCWSSASALLARNCSNCILGVFDCSLSPSHCSISLASFTSSLGPFFYKKSKNFNNEEQSEEWAFTCV